MRCRSPVQAAEWFCRQLIIGWADLLKVPSMLQAEIQDIIKIGYLNGLFVLARSIGLIGHALDQKRLQQGLYRHPWDEVRQSTTANNAGQVICWPSLQNWSVCQWSLPAQSQSIAPDHIVSMQVLYTK